MTAIGRSTGSVRRCIACAYNVFVMSLGRPISTYRRETTTATTAQLRARPSLAMFPDCYSWFVFLSAMDLFFTLLILHPAFGAEEVNVLARWVIQHGGLRGIIAYKFGLVGLIVLICEIVGRRREGLGRKLAEWCVAVTTIPVTLSFIQLLVAVIAGRLRLHP